MRAKKAEITDDEVKTVLASGVEKAKQISEVTIKRVRDAIGINQGFK